MTEPRESGETQLDRAIAIYLDWIDSDSPGSPDELLAEHPEHRDLLEDLLAGSRPGSARGEISQRQLGEYVILDELGRGAMGVVYQAEQESLQRRVALKTLPAGVALDLTTVLRFQREARLAGSLKHPGITAVFETGQADGVHFLAMELIDGEPLDRCIEAASKVPPPERGRAVAELLGEGATTSLSTRSWADLVVDLGIQIADALAHAHEHGVIHRDVKPSNILLRRDGTTALTDFGLARENGLPSVTMTGQFAGSPYYVSPEQAVGNARDLDGRTDVFSLGTTLYELLTMRRPFEGDSSTTVIRAILERDPASPRRRSPEISPDLDAVIMKALEKETSQRYQAAADLAADLRRVRDRKPVSARRVGAIGRARRWARREPLVAGALALVLITLLAGTAISLVLLSESRANLARFDLLSLIPRIEDATADIASTRPPRPENADAIRTWLTETGRPIAAQLPVVRAALEDLRSRPADDAPTVEPTADTSPPEPEAPADRFLARTLADLETDLEQFVTRTVAGMEHDLEWSLSLRERTIDTHQQAWQRVSATIAENPAYDGLTLRPQLGLVPVGTDPDSGLQEFVHLRSWPEGASVPERGDDGRLPLTPDAGIVFVLIPGGSFSMGAQTTPGKANHDPQAQEDEGPVHQVDLEPFFLSKYELTQAQWLRLTNGDNPSTYTIGVTIYAVDQTITEQHPVESASWLECDALLSSWGLMLPTEAQWEYACRAGTDTPWPTGAEAASLDGFANLADRTVQGIAPWHLEEWLDDGSLVHAPVGRYAPNAFGLHDVIGNVRELCRDLDGTYELPVDPGDGLRNAVARTPEARSVRGGYFGSTTDAARSSKRSVHISDARDEQTGVRPARRIER